MLHGRSQKTNQTLDNSTNGESIICVDGACKGSRGRGGWAAVLYEQGQRNILSGNDRFTTAHRMMLLAAIKGLEAVKHHKQIILYSSDRYLANAMAHKSNRTANHDLWGMLDEFSQNKNIIWRWASNSRRSPGNEIANRVANMEALIFETQDTRPRRQSSPQTHHKDNKFNRRQNSSSRTSRKNGKGNR